MRPKWEKCGGNPRVVPNGTIVRGGILKPGLHPEPPVAPGATHRSSLTGRSSGGGTLTPGCTRGYIRVVPNGTIIRGGTLNPRLHPEPPVTPGATHRSSLAGRSSGGGTSKPGLHPDPPVAPGATYRSSLAGRWHINPYAARRNVPLGTTGG